MAVPLAMVQTGHGQLAPAFARQTVRMERGDEERPVDQPPFSALVHKATVPNAPGVPRAIGDIAPGQSDEPRPNDPEATSYEPTRVIQTDETATLLPVDVPPGRGNTPPTGPTPLDQGSDLLRQKQTVGAPFSVPSPAGIITKAGTSGLALSQRAALDPDTNQAPLGKKLPSQTINPDRAQPESVVARPLQTGPGSTVVIDEHERSPASIGARPAPHADSMRPWPPARDVHGDSVGTQYTDRSKIEVSLPTTRALSLAGSKQSTPGQDVAALRQPSSHQLDTAEKAQPETGRTISITTGDLPVAGGQGDDAVALRSISSPLQAPGQPLDRGDAESVPSAKAPLRAEPTRAQPIDGQPGAVTAGATYTRSFLSIPNAASATAALSEKFSSILPKVRVDSAQRANGPVPQTVSQGPAVADSRAATAARSSGSTFFAAEPMVDPFGDEDVKSMPSTRHDGTPSATGVSHATSAASSQPQIWSTVGAIRQMVAESQGALGDARSVDLDLATQELGRLKLSLAANDGTMFIHLQADRPDTLDLFRRHGDILARALQDIGYEGIDFSFSDQENGTARHGARDDNASTAHSPHREVIEQNHVAIDAAWSSAPREDRVDLMM